VGQHPRNVLPLYYKPATLTPGATMSKLKTIQARISVRLLEAVDREAKARTVTRSEVIRTAITREMERVDSWPPKASEQGRK